MVKVVVDVRVTVDLGSDDTDGADVTAATPVFISEVRVIVE